MSKGVGKYQINAKDEADKITREVRKLVDDLSNDLKMLSYQQFLSNTNLSGIEWYRWQTNNLSKLRKQLNEEGRKQLQVIKDKLNKDLIGIELDKKSVNKINAIVKNNVVSIRNSVLNAHESTLGASTQVLKEIKSNEVPKLYKQIVNMVNQSPPDKFGRIELERDDGSTYKMTLEAYTERQIRTVTQREIGSNMVDAGYQANQIWYICSSFNDSRPDHSDLQGRIYIDERWESSVQDKDVRDQIQDYIDANDIKTIQWAMSDGVGLSTWCNCRHYFQYISQDEVFEIKSNKDLNNKLDELDLSRGNDWSESKYMASQQQRYYERKIREKKKQYKMAETEYHALPKDASIEDKLKVTTKYLNKKNQLSSYQAKMRKHLKENTFLNRIPNRESPEYSYNLGVDVPKYRIDKDEPIAKLRKEKKELKEEKKSKRQ